MGGPNLITMVLIEGRQEGHSRNQGKRCANGNGGQNERQTRHTDRKRQKHVMLLNVKIEERATH